MNSESSRSHAAFVINIEKRVSSRFALKFSTQLTFFNDDHLILLSLPLLSSRHLIHPLKPCGFVEERSH